MGFFHEQNRPDRDDYVDVIWENIEATSRSQFFKNADPDVDLPTCNPFLGPTFDNCDQGIVGDTYGIGYDYESIMHYGRNL